MIPLAYPPATQPELDAASLVVIRRRAPWCSAVASSASLPRHAAVRTHSLVPLFGLRREG